MSLDSIGALRQLAQVREQSATMQNDNLEKVQGAVQQISVSEAQRSDSLSLQEAKAQYEVELSKATLDRIQSQLAREKTSAAVTAISTGFTVAFAVADTAINMARDFKGGQKLGTSNQGKEMDSIAENDAESYGAGNDIYTSSRGKKTTTDQVVKEDGTVDVDMAMKYGLITMDSNNKLSVTENGTNNGLSIGEDGKANSKDKKPLSFTSETVYRTTLGLNSDNVATNNVAFFSGATITSQDVKAKAIEANFTEDEIKGINSFSDLYNKGEKGRVAASSLFDSKGREVNEAESPAASKAFKAGLKTLESGKSSDTNGVNRRIGEINSSLDAKLKMEGKIDNGTSVKDGAKYVFNGIVSLATTIVPQIQALMAAKEKVAQTEIELQAAIEKLSAAQKKLRQIQDLIESVGGDNLGNANGQAETGLS